MTVRSVRSATTTGRISGELNWPQVAPSGLCWKKFSSVECRWDDSEGGKEEEGGEGKKCNAVLTGKS